MPWHNPECEMCNYKIQICDDYVEIKCFQNKHAFHLECYNSYADAQKRLKKQDCLFCIHVDTPKVEITNIDWLNIAIIFDFDPDALMEMEDLSNEAQYYVRSFQRGEIAREQLQTSANEALFCYLYSHSD